MRYDFGTCGEQIETSLRFVLDDDAYYEELGDRPSRLKAAAVQMVREQIGDGYHFKVISFALRVLAEDGLIDGSDPAFTHEQLYR
jgi:hypothetical protein